MKNPGKYFKFKMTFCILGGYMFSADLREAKQNLYHT